MADRTLLLQISDDRIFFNPALSMPLAQTNIPETDLRFKSNRVFYWRVRMERFDPEAKQLWVEVLEYNAAPGERFRQQKPKDDVRSLVFKELDWQFLEPQLSYYTKIKLTSILKNVPPEQADKNPEWLSGEAPNPQRSTMRFRFDVPFADLQFSLGYVRFTKHLEKIDRTVAFKILNDHLLPEFEYIKFGLAQKLGKRKIKVEAEIRLCNGDIESTRAVSKEIDAISSDFIDSVKQQRTLELSKKPDVIQPDKSLFTSEDVFDQFDEDRRSQGNVFRQSEKDILETLLGDKSIRNRQQLIYLSGAKQSKNEKIRFTLAPNFGFLFLVEGEQYNHFVWELLNSHATYIWSIGKTRQELTLQYQRIEQAINIIRNTSRSAYKNAYRQQQTDQDLLFNYLQHQHADSALVDGFPKWKHQLNALLV
jgi:hypothetical protein